MDAERSKEQYRECMHNHAASLGTYATDGCGEFMPDMASGGGLHCAACGCHRNFHRKYERAGEKRRTRTKFSAEQKERMQQFAEKIGWRVQKKGGATAAAGDEIAVFCREIGVSRQVFKVWMHNHKNSSASPPPAGGGGGGVATSVSPLANATFADDDDDDDNDNIKGNVSSLTQ
ncbi:unnamed protein product [Spirodela intermedia]|uniref:ZF-HD dimerization-type domain-containing protein n=1 Tax=Spirodela intermedia TaxID=51605 RepID=A0A7I8IQF6_SPIIN|nr:unnamed protein product [Spirodela intermedia]CAA6659362.1 unnamed protein product [Spirodela intermedia]